MELRRADDRDQARGATGAERARLGSDVFSERFLIRRPLLQALEPDPAGPPILLIDELDRTDEAFEAYLLELLSDFQVTIPELGTVRAPSPPIVIVTSNRTREIHDALKRRCLYHWVDYPDAARELAILRAKVPKAPAALSKQVVAFVQAIRREDLFKAPGVAETLDWASALVELDAVALDPALVSDTPRRAPQIPGRHRPHDRLESEGAARQAQGRGLTWTKRRSRAGSPTTSPISPGRCARRVFRWAGPGPRCDRGRRGRGARLEGRSLLGRCARCSCRGASI